MHVCACKPIDYTNRMMRQHWLQTLQNTMLINFLEWKKTNSPFENVVCYNLAAQLAEASPFPSFPFAPHLNGYCFSHVSGGIPFPHHICFSSTAQILMFVV